METPPQGVVLLTFVSEVRCRHMIAFGLCALPRLARLLCALCVECGPAWGGRAGVRRDGGARAVKRAHQTLGKWLLSSCAVEVTLTELGVFGQPPDHSLVSNSLCGRCFYTFSQPGRGRSLGLRFQSHAMRLVDGLAEVWAQGPLGGRIGKTPCQLDGGGGAAPPRGPGC